MTRRGLITSLFIVAAIGFSFGVRTLRKVNIYSYMLIVISSGVREIYVKLLVSFLDFGWKS